MAEKEIRRCGTCGHRFENRKDALVWCKHLQTFVVRDSVACLNWTDGEYF